MKQKNGYRRLLDAFVIVCILFSFIGCKSKDPQPSVQELNGVQGYEGNDPRFTVERVAVIYDDLAYRNARAIYILHDSKTGKEYVGLSGIGISELGSHSELRGKITVQVPEER